MLRCSLANDKAQLFLQMSGAHAHTHQRTASRLIFMRIHAYIHTYILAEEWQPRVTMVTWETCVEHALPWQLFDRLTPPFASSKQSAALKKACTAYENLVRYNVSNKNTAESVFCPCDLVTHTCTFSSSICLCALARSISIGYAINSALCLCDLVIFACFVLLSICSPVTCAHRVSIGYVHVRVTKYIHVWPSCPMDPWDWTIHTCHCNGRDCACIHDEMRARTHMRGHELTHGVDHMLRRCKQSKYMYVVLLSETIRGQTFALVCRRFILTQQQVVRHKLTLLSSSSQRSCLSLTFRPLCTSMQRLYSKIQASLCFTRTYIAR